MPETPTEVLRFWHLLRDHIVLKSNGMGVELRESREGLSKLLQQHDYDYEIYKPFIDDYEDHLLEQHFKEQEKKKDK